MSFSKRLMDPQGYGPPPVTVCCGVVPEVEGLRFKCPKCGLTETDKKWKGVKSG